MSEGREEKEREEKERREGMEGLEEKWRRDPVSGLIFGLIVIWLGLILFTAFGAGHRMIPGASKEYLEENFWGYFLLGVGVIFILEILIRSALPEYRRPIFGRLLAGVALIFIGGGGILGIEQWWPLIIVAVGVLIVIYGFLRAVRPT